MPAGSAEVRLQRREQVVPERGFFGGLNLGQVENDRRSRAAHPLVIVDDVEDDVGDRCGEARPVVMAQMPIVEVQAAGTEDPGREVELLPPVDDDPAAEESFRPGVHLGGDGLGSGQEPFVAMDGELEIALIVERHARDLAERVLAVEHPAVRAGQQRVGDVADAALERRPRLGGRTGALNPLPLQVARDLRAFEIAGACVAHRHRRPADERVRVEEFDAPAASRALFAAGEPRRHQRLAVGIEDGERLQGVECGRSVDVGVV